MPITSPVLCKSAQTWGYFAPAHDAEDARKFHEETTPVANNVAKSIAKAPIAAAGAVGGALAGAREADDTYGWRGFLHPWESMKMIGRGMGIGAKTGWREAGRVYSDAASTAAGVGNDLGLVSDDAMAGIDKWNDEKILESARRAGVAMPDELPRDPKTGQLLPTLKPEYADYDRFIDWARYGRFISVPALEQAAFMGAGKAMGAGASKLTGSDKAGKIVHRLTNAVGVPAVVGARDAKDLYNDFKEQKLQVDRNVFEGDIERARHMDPSTNEYRKAYELLKKFRDLDPEAIDSLPAPVQTTSSPYGWSRFAPGGWEGGVAGGLGGLGIGGLLGLLFGGGKGMWKLGLLGALLGGLHGSGMLGSAWNSLKNGRSRGNG